MENRICLTSPVGPIELAEVNGHITRLQLRRCEAAGKESDVLREAACQLNAYFGGKIHRFDLPLAPEGTPFQMAVWQALREIPYGATRSYKEIAASVGCEKGFRAVGMANNRNPILIMIPCHRVIGADGSLVGYGGGLEVKKFLLRLEGAI